MLSIKKDIRVTMDMLNEELGTQINTTDLTTTDIDINLMYLKNNHTLCIGRDGSGKTTYALSNAMKLYHKKKIKTIYIDFDSKSIEQQDTFSNIMDNMQGVYISGTRVYYNNKLNNIALFLEDLIKLVQQKFHNEDTLNIIIDNWTKIATIAKINENNNNEVSELIKDIFVKRLMQIPNVSITLIAHTGKDITKGVRGASALRGIFGISYIIDMTEDNIRTLKISKLPIGIKNIQIGDLFMLTKKENDLIDIKKIEKEIELDRDELYNYKMKHLRDIAISLLQSIKIKNMDNGLALLGLYEFKTILMHLAEQITSNIKDKKYLSDRFIIANTEIVLHRAAVRIVKYEKRKCIEVDTILETKFNGVFDFDEHKIIVDDFIATHFEKMAIYIKEQQKLQDEKNDKLISLICDVIEIISEDGDLPTKVNIRKKIISKEKYIVDLRNKYSISAHYINKYLTTTIQRMFNEELIEQDLETRALVLKV